MRLLIAYSIIGPTILIFGSATFLIGLLHLPLRWCDALGRLFARIVLFACHTRVVNVVWHTDRDALPDQLVLVSNHSSHLDALVIMSSLVTRGVRFVVKQSLMRIPFLGWGMRGAGYVPVTRRHAQRDIARLADPRARARDRDLLFFAEGTRSLDGELQPFKKGAFAFALTHQRAILPMAVGGAFESMPPNTYMAVGGPVALVIGKPVPVDGIGVDQREELRDRVRAQVVELRAEAIELAAAARAQE